MPTPEELARQNIDKQLLTCGWVVQDRLAMNLYSNHGVAVRDYPLETGTFLTAQKVRKTEGTQNQLDI